jgi:hypothetical protein
VRRPGGDEGGDGGDERLLVHGGAAPHLAHHLRRACVSLPLLAQHLTHHLRACVSPSLSQLRTSHHLRRVRVCARVKGDLSKATLERGGRASEPRATVGASAETPGASTGGDGASTGEEALTSRHAGAALRTSHLTFARARLIIVRELRRVVDAQAISVLPDCALRSHEERFSSPFASCRIRPSPFSTLSDCTEHCAPRRLQATSKTKPARRHRLRLSQPPRRPAARLMYRYARRPAHREVGGLVAGEGGVGSDERRRRCDDLIVHRAARRLRRRRRRRRRR